jgi:hypothetical protein
MRGRSTGETEIGPSRLDGRPFFEFADDEFDRGLWDRNHVSIRKTRMGRLGRRLTSILQSRNLRAVADAGASCGHGASGASSHNAGSSSG